MGMGKYDNAPYRRGGHEGAGAEVGQRGGGGRGGEGAGGVTLQTQTHGNSRRGDGMTVAGRRTGAGSTSCIALCPLGSCSLPTVSDIPFAISAAAASSPPAIPRGAQHSATWFVCTSPLCISHSLSPPLSPPVAPPSAAPAPPQPFDEMDPGAHSAPDPAAAQIGGFTAGAVLLALMYGGDGDRDDGGRGGNDGGGGSEAGGAGSAGAGVIGGAPALQVGPGS
jgi:hypothetical protein